MQSTLELYSDSLGGQNLFLGDRSCKLPVTNTNELCLVKLTKQQSDKQTNKYKIFQFDAHLVSTKLHAS